MTEAHEYEKGHMEERYNSRNPLVRYFFNKRLKVISENFPLWNKLKVLDAGCGEGHLLEYLYNKNPGNTYYGYNKNPGNTYYGIDLFDSKVKEARERCKFADIRQMDLLDLKFTDNYFDVVVCESTLEHIPNYLKAIRELERVTKNILIIGIPNEFMLVAANTLLLRNPTKPPDHYNSFFPVVLEKLCNFSLISKTNIPANCPFILSIESVLVFKKRGKI